MLLDRDALARIIEDQVVGTLLLKKKYHEVACERDAKGELLRVGMTTTEFLSHFKMMYDLINKWQPVEIPRGHIPALMVVPFSLVSLEERIGRIRFRGVPGTSELKEELIVHDKDIPDEPYLLIDINKGKWHRSRDGLEYHYCEQRAHGWYPDQHSLTLNEGMELITHHPRILHPYADYSIELGGSCTDKWREGLGLDIELTLPQHPLLKFRYDPLRISICMPTREDRNSARGTPYSAMRIDPRKY